MKQKIEEIVKNNVRTVCETHRLKTGDDYWNHIQSVVRLSAQLSTKFNADNEIVVLGAYLHDISVPSEYGDFDDHHIYSTELAEKMLKRLEYPTPRIEHVKKCVLHHRGSKFMLKGTVEEECVADADTTYFPEQGKQKPLAEQGVQGKKQIQMYG